MLLRLEFFFLITICASAFGGQVVFYEGNGFPEQTGWTRDNQVYQTDRTIEDGWLVLRAEVVPQSPPFIDVSEQDFYRRSLADFAGTNGFFVEWRMETDGPRTGFPNVSPAAIVASGDFGIGYHFTIADDQIRLIRDNLLPILYVDIEPGIPHTYRLELYGATSYTFLIDGEVVDSGIPEGAYPTADSRIVFGGRAAIPDAITTVRWDYIRYGTIPEPATGLMLLAGSLAAMHRRKPRR